ncbi:MAG TPA: type II secretion system protein [Sedimentisphaerales bacterium]|nr:type II secretion system protein [Sedimentisphaerales bacterium]
MTVGLPGTGIGGIFYILLSAYMPLVHLRRALNGGNKPYHLKMVLSALSMSALIILSLYGEARLLLCFFDWAATVQGKAPGSVKFAACVPAALVPALAAMPFLVLLAIVVFIQIARLVVSVFSRRGTAPLSGPAAADGQAAGADSPVGRPDKVTPGNIIKTNAFTLIEVLVVISIISLLMAILLPTFNTAREQMNTMTCRSNLRQHGFAATVYADDNESLFPDPGGWLFLEPWADWMGPKCCQWHNSVLIPDGSLWSYRDPLKIHMCPTFFRVSQQPGQNHPFHDPSIPVEPRYSYSMNALLGFPDYPAVPKVTQVRRPAQVFLFSEENMWMIPGVSIAVLNDTLLLPRYPPYGPEDIGDSFATYHAAKAGDLNSGKANLVFVDGHVDWIHIGAENVDEAFRFAWPRRESP